MDYRSIVTIKMLSRMAKKIDKQDNGCWYWTGSKWPDGYGQVFIFQKAKPAHKVLYEIIHGKMPDGFVTDHLCHTQDQTCKGGQSCLHRRCVNPEHIEPVTNAENVLRGNGLSANNARKTLCKRGHEFGEQTAFYKSLGRRRCNTCNNLKQNMRRGYYAAN